MDATHESEQLREEFIAFLERWISKQQQYVKANGTITKQVEAWLRWFRDSEHFTVKNVLRRITNCISSFTPDLQDELQVVFDLMRDEVGEPV